MSITLPRRVRVSDGAILSPSGTDPYTLPWVEGAADTLHPRTLTKYKKQHNDIKTKLAQASKRRKERASGN